MQKPIMCFALTNNLLHHSKGGKLNEIVEKMQFCIISSFYMGFDSFIQRRNRELSCESVSFSNPSWLGFIVHILIQLLIICIPTIIVIKYLDLNVKQLLFSIPVMYLLFAVYSPPALYMFVFTGEWNGFWQQSHPAMSAWMASLLITLQYGIVISITKLIVYLKATSE